MKSYDIIQGDVRDVLRTLPDESVHMVCTSPPYFALRDYGIPGQIGLELTPAAFVQTMVEVFREVRRVLRKDGTLWLNLGDSYAGGGGYYPDSPANQNGSMQAKGNAKGHRNIKKIAGRAPLGHKPKDLLGMPWRVAFALQEDGWYLRSAITWCKRAPMPESVTDRPTSATEMIFLLAREERYFYDPEAVRTELAPGELDKRRPPRGLNSAAWDASVYHSNPDMPSHHIPMQSNPSGANMRNFWLLGPEPYAAAHFATVPTAIPDRCIRAGTSERGVCPQCGAPWRRVVERTWTDKGWTGGKKRADTPGQELSPSSGFRLGGSHDSVTKGWAPSCKCGRTDTVPATVLDPFSGAGTTALVALRLGRRAIGIELNAEYIAMSHKRIQGDPQAMNLNMQLEEIA
jgi:DNA modification methylase